MLQSPKIYTKEGLEVAVAKSEENFKQIRDVDEYSATVFYDT